MNMYFSNHMQMLSSIFSETMLHVSSSSRELGCIDDSVARYVVSADKCDRIHSKTVFRLLIPKVENV